MFLVISGFVLDDAAGAVGVTVSFFPAKFSASVDESAGAESDFLK